jgi:hypothetical protein
MKSELEHDRHDRLLVARYAAGDAYPSEVDRAERQIEACSECAALASDIRLISARVAGIEPISRTRDFRISAQRAQEMRSSWFERMLRGISSPGWTVVRPLAGAALAIGMVLSVVGALPIGAISGSASDALLPPNFSTQGNAVAPAGGVQPTRSAAMFDLSSLDTPGPGTQSASSGGGLVSAPGGGTQPENASTSPEVNAASGTPNAPKGDGTAIPAASGATAPVDASARTAPPPVATAAASRLPATPVDVAALITPDANTPNPNLVAPTAAIPVGHAYVASISEPTLDRSLLLIVGLGLALGGLIAFAVVWVIRRRYSDPLIR